MGDRTWLVKWDGVGERRNRTLLVMWDGKDANAYSTQRQPQLSQTYFVVM